MIRPNGTSSRRAAGSAPGGPGSPRSAPAPASAPSRGGRPVGAATPRSTQCTTALASPAMNLSAAVITRTGTGSRRSAAARSTISRTVWCTTRTTWPAPVSSAAPTAPSSTRCGATASRTLSLSLAGSPSTPLPMTIRTGPAGQGAQLDRGGKARAAPPGQPGALDLVDELVAGGAGLGARRAGPVPGQVLGQGGRAARSPRGRAAAGSIAAASPQRRAGNASRPGEIGQPVHRPPGAEAQPGPQHAGQQDRGAQVDGQRAEADGQPPVGRQERDHRRRPADRHVRVEDGRDHVQAEQRHGEQGQRPVQFGRDEARPGAGAEPAARRHPEHHDDGAAGPAGRARCRARRTTVPATPPRRRRSCRRVRASRQPAGQSSGQEGGAAVRRRRPASRRAAAPRRRGHQPGGQPGRGQPGFRVAARHDRRGGGGVGLGAAGRGDAHRPPRPVRRATRCAGRRCGAPPARPAATSGRSPTTWPARPPVSRTTCPAPLPRPGSEQSATATGQPPAGGGRPRRCRRPG